MFKPINKFIEVAPVEEDAFMSSERESFEEKGVVVSIADDVTRVEVGQTVFFESWLCKKFPTRDGTVRYVVQEENVMALEQ